MTNAADLQIVIRLKDEVSGAIEGVSNKVGGLGNKLGTALKVGAAAGGVAIAGLAVGAFKLGESFDDAYDAIAIGTGATGAVLEGLQKDFKAVFTSVPTDMASASEAIAELNARTGLTGEALQGLAEQELELARMTKTDLNSQIETTTRLFGDWSVAAKDQSGALDKLFVTSQQTGIGIDRLAAMMVQYGAPLRQMGFSFEQAAAVMGKFEKEGVNSEVVMGSLRIALGKMARAGEPAAETFQRVIEEIKNAGSVSEANALALETFGVKAGPDMAAAIREGRFEIGNLLTALDGSQGAIMNTADSTRDFAESFTLMKNKLLVAVEPIVSRVFVGMSKAMEAAGPYLERFSAWLDKNIPVAMAKVEEAWVKLEPVRSAFTEGLRVLLNVGEKVATWLGQHKEALIAVGAAFGVLLVVLFPIPAAILAIITAIGFLSEHWDEIKEKTLEVWDTISDFLDEKLGWMRGIMEAAWTDMLAKVTFAWDTIKNYVETTINVVKDVINIAMALLHGDWQAAWDGIKQLVTDVWEGIKTQIDTSIELVKGVFAGFPSYLLGLAGDFLNAGLSLGGAILSGLLSGLKAVPDLLGDLTEQVWSALKAVINIGIQAINDLIPNSLDFKVKGVGVSIGLPDNPIPSLASGTPYFGGGLALVGEQGPELLALPGGSRVYSNADSRQIVSERTSIGRQGPTYNIYAPVYVTPPANDGDWLARELEKQVR